MRDIWGLPEIHQAKCRQSFSSMLHEERMKKVVCKTYTFARRTRLNAVKAGTIQNEQFGFELLKLTLPVI